MPSIGLPLRSSLHWSHTGSGRLGLYSFSILPVSTPPSSLMRTSAFAWPVSSSIVFHKPPARVLGLGAAAEQQRAGEAGDGQGNGCAPAG